MRILFVVDQAEGVASDLAGGLPPALAALGHEVRVAAPMGGRAGRARGRSLPAARVAVPHVGGAQVARVGASQARGVTHFYIVGAPLGRGPEGVRAAFFSLTVIGLCRALEWPPDVVHVAGALGGPAVYWLRAAGRHDDFFKRTATVFTISDLRAGRGGDAAALLAYGMAPSDSLLLPDWARASPIGLGLAHAGRLCADGPSQARELLTPAGGQGFEGLLTARQDHTTGILEGLDLETWDPARDRALRARYSEATLDRRSRNKRALQREFGLNVAAGVPLLAANLRPKGEAVLAAMEQLLADPSPAGAVQVALLASGATGLELQARALVRRHPGQAVVRRMNDGLERGIYGGADVVIVDGAGGGLRHRAALRYGAVPVARQAGSAADIVVERGPRANGFGFADYNAAPLLAAARRALTRRGQPARWRAMQQRGMRQALGWGWEHAAHAYLTLYQQALADREEL